MTSVKTMFESLLLTGINGTEYGYESDLTDARIPLNGILDPIRGSYVSAV